MGHAVTPYDYVIVGGGLSGLLTAYRMAHEPWFDDKKILIIEPEINKSNDRTWCYWEQGPGDWDHLIQKQWTKAKVMDDITELNLELGDYAYKMLRSAEFYREINLSLDRCSHIQRMTTRVESMIEHADRVEVVTDQVTIVGKHVCTSVLGLNAKPITHRARRLQQHFGGWFVKTEQEVFNAEEVLLMDFSVPQQDGVCFMYVLPIHTNEALVEFTVFGPNPWSMEQYENQLLQYMQNKQTTYTIMDREMGTIPMTVYPFERNNTSRIVHIGTAGGWTRPSTGYTFKSSCQISKQLINSLKQGRNSSVAITRRHRFYDTVMLEMIAEKPALGRPFFMHIYGHQPIDRVFRFLDGTTTLRDELLFVGKAQPRWALIGFALKWFWTG